MSAMRDRLTELVLASANESFSEEERMELNTMLRDNPAARNYAARHLKIDALLADSLATRQHATAFQPIPISTGRFVNRPKLLARAAAMIGAFFITENASKASTIIIMKKALTSITAAILVIGGSGIYVINSHNASARTRIARMETEIKSLSDQLGIKTADSTNRPAGTNNAPEKVSVAPEKVFITQVLAVYNDDNFISPPEDAILKDYEKQLDAMDAEAVKNQLLIAEKISNPINGHAASMIMEKLIKKDPSMATQIAAELIGRGTGFQFHLSHSAEDAFNAWMAKDPAAADAWYLATAAAGGLNSKSIPPNGLGHLAIDRSFARSRFAAQVLKNPSEAAAMLSTMLAEDVTTALKTITNPDALKQILPKLSPAQQAPAAEGVIKAMAASDPKAAFTLAQSLEMDAPSRNGLLATAIEAAVDSGKLHLAGASEWSKNLDLDAKRRSEVLVSAATSVSKVPVKNRFDFENNVAWGRVTERIDWLRKEAPAGTASRAVGTYLGQLADHSGNLDKTMAAYEREVASVVTR